MIPFNVIINADDFGFNHHKNNAILNCFINKTINSASVMVNLSGFEESISIIRKYNLKKQVGIHVNLTEGVPLTNFSKTGLIDSNGAFIKKNITKPLLFSSKDLKLKIEAEIEQQYSKIVENGIIPVHINSHHHVHTLPWLAPIFLRFAKQKNIKIRIAQSYGSENIIKDLYRKYLNRQYKKHYLNFSDRFENINSFPKSSSSKDSTNTLFEIMVHPDYRNDIIIDAVEQVNFNELIYEIFSPDAKKSSGQANNC